MRRAGFVLVGGKSRRMGRDKAFLSRGDRFLAATVAQVAMESAGSACLIGDPRLYSTLGFPVYPDLHPGRGPLSGLEAVFAHSEADWNLVLACDMPLLSRTVPDILFARAAQVSPLCRCVIPVSAEGRPQPLCALYHSTCQSDVEQALSEDRLRMLDLIPLFNPIFVSFPDPGLFAPANTPAEWANLQASLP